MCIYDLTTAVINDILVKREPDDSVIHYIVASLSFVQMLHHIYNQIQTPQSLIQFRVAAQLDATPV